MIKKLAILSILTIVPAYGAWPYGSIPSQSGPPSGPVPTAPYWNGDNNFIPRPTTIIIRPESQRLSELKERRDQASDHHAKAQLATLKADELVRIAEEAVRHAQEHAVKTKALRDLLKKEEKAHHDEWEDLNRAIEIESGRRAG